MAWLFVTAFDEAGNRGSDEPTLIGRFGVGCGSLAVGGSGSEDLAHLTTSPIR